MTYTAGPWNTFSLYARHEVRTPSGTLVAVARSRDDARLISAAPDLLRLLKEARQTLEMWKDVAPAVSLCMDMDAAIQKAGGGD